MYTILMPACENGIGIFKAWLMRCGNRALAGLLDEFHIVSEFPGPFGDQNCLGFHKIPAGNSESLHDTVVDLAVCGRIGFCLFHGCDVLAAPAKSNLFHITDARVSLADTVFHKVNDQLCRKMQGLMPVKDRVDIGWIQWVLQIGLHDKKEF